MLPNCLKEKNVMLFLNMANRKVITVMTVNHCWKHSSHLTWRTKRKLAAQLLKTAQGSRKKQHPWKRCLSPAFRKCPPSNTIHHLWKNSISEVSREANSSILSTNNTTKKKVAADVSTLTYAGHCSTVASWGGEGEWEWESERHNLKCNHQMLLFPL